jgi:uncharacterized cupredoxin-like copper-binding protein
MMTRMMTLASVLLAMLVFVSVPPLGAEEVKIVGRDFAFEAPAILGPGMTTFVFQNPGEVRHEMIIALLQHDVTEQQIKEAHQAGIALRKQLEQFGDGEILGILLARPHQSSSGKLIVDLVHGRTYLIICQIEDPQGMPRHNVLGMYRTFRVE